MAIRERYGVWHYRFNLDGKEYSGKTDLAATSRNESAARQHEAEHRKALLEGRAPARRIVVWHLRGCSTGISQVGGGGVPRPSKQLSPNCYQLDECYGVLWGNAGRQD